MDHTKYTDSHWYDRRLRGDDDDDDASATNIAVVTQEDNNNNNDDDDDDQDSLYCLPDLHGNSDILTQMHIRELSNFLPARAEGYAWTLAFTTTTMGFSLKSLYRSLSKYEGPVLLIIRDNQDAIFGAFSSCSLNPSESFYGTGETYLFTFKSSPPISSASSSTSSTGNIKSSGPTTQLTSCIGDDSGSGIRSNASSNTSSASTISKSNQNITNSTVNSKNKQRKFKRFQWTGDNLYFIKGNSDSLAFGAGEGNFGLWLDEDLYHGSTHSCKTFNNEPLTYQEDFVVCTLECWVFL